MMEVVIASQFALTRDLEFPGSRASRCSDGRLEPLELVGVGVEPGFGFRGQRAETVDRRNLGTAGRKVRLVYSELPDRVLTDALGYLVEHEILERGGERHPRAFRMH